jgi:glutaredoxin-like YruB-family protein
MLKTARLSIAAIALLLPLTLLAAPTGGVQSPVKVALPVSKEYPRIVLYSTSWCPHCRQVKEYFASKGIPYINRDVEQESAALDDLLNRYKSQGVPVVVIGNDEKILRGFTAESFETALKEVHDKSQPR